MRSPRMCGVERDTRASFIVRLGMHGGAGGLGAVFGGVVNGGGVALLHRQCQGARLACGTLRVGRQCAT